MGCRICIELEQFLQSAQRPESPDLLAGLSEAGKRNRIHQRQEKILKTEADIGRHKKSCLYSLEQVSSAS